MAREKFRKYVIKRICLILICLVNLNYLVRANEMKYIGVDRNGIYVIENYLNYIKECDFKSDIESLLSLDRWDIHSPTSLHDAKITKVSFNIDWSGDGYSIDLILMGPMHDRIYKLRYEGVVSSDFGNITRYGDLLIHELYLENGVYIHNFEFDDSPFEVRAKNVIFEEVILEK